MPIKNSTVFSIILSLLLGSAVAQAGNLFEYGGKSINESDLTPAAAQQIYDIKNDAYLKTLNALDGAVLDMYFAEQAKKRKISAKAVEEEALKTDDPSESEVKKFYEENKARIPYPYEQIKAEVKRILVGKKKNEIRSKLVDKVKKQKRVKISLKAPPAITVKLDVAGLPSKGSKNAKVELVEFADYQCPHCKHAADMLKAVMKKQSKQAKLTFVDFPINPSGVSRVVAHGSHCAQKQNKFWDYHYMAFDNQQKLKKSSPSEFAKKLGLDVKAFNKCIESKWAKEQTERGRMEGERVGVSGTPTIYINGKKFLGPNTVEGIAKAIEKEVN